MPKKLGRTVRGPKTTKGIFCGQITARVEPEIHKILYNEAFRRNVTISYVVAEKVLAQMEREHEHMLKKVIWTHEAHIDRGRYTAIFFKNNMDNMEVCVQLLGKYRETEDVLDKEHKISDYIKNCLETNGNVPIPSCEFVLNENNEKEIKPFGVLYE